MVASLVWPAYIVYEEGLGSRRKLLDLRLLYVVLAMMGFALHDRRDVAQLLLVEGSVFADQDEGALLGSCARARNLELLLMLLGVRPRH